jgi:hypothetical protein
MFNRAPRGDKAVLEEPKFVTLPKRLLLHCFSLKNGSSCKTFGRASLEEPLPEPERSPTKQAFYMYFVKF